MKAGMFVSGQGAVKMPIRVETAIAQKIEINKIIFGSKFLIRSSARMTSVLTIPNAAIPPANRARAETIDVARDDDHQHPTAMMP